MTTASTQSGRRLKGVVVSNKMQKTISVRVDRLKKHPKYLKYLKTHQKFLAHDEKEECNVGDTVRIQETRPLSKRKNWKVIEVIKKGVSPAGQRS